MRLGKSVTILRAEKQKPFALISIEVLLFRAIHFPFLQSHGTI
jgi:hypothetical protein